jgi:acetyl-CoA carboxylase/biotin carboxylase 1
VDGESHVVHVEEEALGTRLAIGSLSTLIANDVDPTRLLAPSPGKLTRHLVADGAHIERNQPYAEVEVRCAVAQCCGGALRAVAWCAVSWCASL